MNNSDKQFNPNPESIPQLDQSYYTYFEKKKQNSLYKNFNYSIFSQNAKNYWNHYLQFLKTSLNDKDKAKLKGIAIAFMSLILMGILADPRNGRKFRTVHDIHRIYGKLHRHLRVKVTGYNFQNKCWEIEHFPLLRFYSWFSPVNPFKTQNYPFPSIYKQNENELSQILEENKKDEFHKQLSLQLSGIKISSLTEENITLLTSIMKTKILPIKLKINSINRNENILTGFLFYPQISLNTFFLPRLLTRTVNGYAIKMGLCEFSNLGIDFKSEKIFNMAQQMKNDERIAKLMGLGIWNDFQSEFISNKYSSWNYWKVKRSDMWYRFKSKFV